MNVMNRLFIIMLLFVCSISAQEFKPWTFELGTGLHWVDGQCDLSLDDNTVDVKARARYNFNETFGLQLSAQHSALSFEGFGKVPYQRAALGVSTNLWNILDIRSNTFKVLMYGDVGYSRMTAKDYIEAQRMFSTSLSIAPVFRVNDDISIKLEATSIMNHGKHASFDFQSATQHTLVNTLHIGVMYHIGKKGSPADWYKRRVKVDTVVLERPSTAVVERTIVEKECIKCDAPSDIMEHVYFRYDVDSIDKDGLDALQHIVEGWKSGDSITVTGHACPSGNPGYNLDLSRRRATNVKQKLQRAGIPESAILLEYKGEDTNKGKHDHDMASRVDIVLKRK
jgi:outer membrane protein OmpA-like peptidoglycan-associated protein